MCPSCALLVGAGGLPRVPYLRSGIERYDDSAEFDNVLRDDITDEETFVVQALVNN